MSEAKTNQELIAELGVVVEQMAAQIGVQKVFEASWMKERAVMQERIEALERERDEARRLCEYYAYNEATFYSPLPWESAATEGQGDE